MPIFRLSDKISFPPPHFAGPEGLLAVGGDLSEKRILLAYQMGIFPWFSDDEPILWWSPDPRLVLYPSDIKISHRLRRTINQGIFQITSDTAFDRVIDACAHVRLQNHQGTWIVDAMKDAYCRLFESGYAHSIEAWACGELAGGLYGLSLGGCFFGESMFARVSNASKVSFAALCDYLTGLSFDLIDCQVTTGHLKRLGAMEMPRAQFLKKLEQSMKRPTLRGKWEVSFQKFIAQL